jgi:hypothetical protein
MQEVRSKKQEVRSKKQESRSKKQDSKSRYYVQDFENLILFGTNHIRLHPHTSVCIYFSEGEKWR